MRVAQSKIVFDDPALWGRDGSWGLEAGRVIAPMQYAKVLRFHGRQAFSYIPDCSTGGGPAFWTTRGGCSI